MIKNIFVIGFHHQVLSSVERGEILMQKDLSLNQLNPSDLAENGLKSATLLKTCNRIELYGYGNLEGAKSLFCSLTDVPNKYIQHLTILNGAEALHHIFKVASGLDSQLLGDQEIVGQFRLSFKESRDNNLLDGFMERLANTCLQASRQIRKKTKLTIGTTSLSYAAIQILKNSNLHKNSKVVVVGLGKFGKSIAKNISKYFPNYELSVANRTRSKSFKLAEELNCEIVDLDKLEVSIDQFDVVISAIQTQKKLWSSANYSKSKSQIIIDLSVPSPFHVNVQKLKGIRYYSIEEATEIVNKTWKERNASVQPALQIIDEFIEEFTLWSRTYSQSHTIKEWKSKLEETAGVCPFFLHMDENEKSYYLQKSMGLFVKFLRESKQESSDQNLIHAYLKVQ